MRTTLLQSTTPRPGASFHVCSVASAAFGDDRLMPDESGWWTRPYVVALSGAVYAFDWETDTLTFR